MPRTKATIKKSGPALRSAPIPGAGVVRKTKSKFFSHLLILPSTTNRQVDTMNNDTTIFRLLKVPKYAKRTLATMCEKKSEEMEKEMNELKRDWMEQEREIEWLRRELERVKGELRAARGGDGGCKATKGEGFTLTQKEADELSALWDACGQ